MSVPFTLTVDWTNAGSFTASADDVSGRIKNDLGIVIDRGGDQPAILSPPMAGSMLFRLDNRSRDYSANNSTSPLAGLIVPGHPVRLKSDYLGITATATAGTGSAYDSIDGVSSYTIQAGDVLTYDIWWVGTTDFAAVDLDDGAGTRLKNLGAVDQNGLNAAPATNIASLAYNTWYSRQIPLPAGIIGKTISRFLIGIDSTWSVGDAGTKRPLVRNIRILDATRQTVQKTIFVWSDSSVTHTSRYTANGCSIDPSDWLQSWPLWGGYLDVPRQRSASEYLDVEFPCLGGLARLKNKLVSTALYQNITITSCLTVILDAVGWPSGTGFGGRMIDTSATTLSWWWLNNEDAYGAVMALLNSEGPGADIFEDNQGRFTFFSRTHKLTAVRSTDSQADLRDRDAPGYEPLFSRPWTYSESIKNIVNAATVTVVTRALQTSQVIWTVGTTISLSPSEVYRIDAVAASPFKTALTPVLGTDYALVSGSLSSIALNRTSGQRLTITITAGATGAVIDSAALDGTGLQLRARPVTIQQTFALNNTIDTSASIAKYGVQSWNSSYRPDIAVNVAQQLVNGVVSIYQNPRAQLSVTVNNATPGRQRQHLEREIGDRVTVRESQSGTEMDVWISRIQQQITHGGASHVVTFGCDQVFPQSYFVLDTSALGTDVLGF